MKYLIPILLFLLPVITQAHICDTVPTGVPQLFGGKYYKFNGYVLVDSFIMNAAGDTNLIPYYPSLKFKSSDNRWYGWDRTRWSGFAYLSDIPNITANNGLTKTSNNIQLGGSLVQNTTIDGTSGFNTTFTYSGGDATIRSLNNGIGSAIYANTSGIAAAINAQNTGTGIGLTATSLIQFGATAASNSNIGLYASTTSGPSAGAFEVNPSSTNTTATILKLLRSTSGTAANNIAGAIEFITEPSSGTTNVTTGYIVSKLTDATFATRTSSMEFHTTNNTVTSRKAALLGNGQWTWDGYPSLTAQTDTTTYKPVVIDGSGNVRQMARWPFVSGAIPTIDTVLGAGNTSINKSLEMLNFSGGGQIRIDINNYDTTNDNTVARLNVISHRGKAVSCLQGPTRTDLEHQWFFYIVNPNTWHVVDSLKSWTWGTVGDDNTASPALKRGMRLVNVYKGNQQVLNIDTMGRVGLTGIIAPKAWLHLPAGTFTSFKMDPEGTPTDVTSGDIHNTGNQLTFADLGGGVHNLVDQIKNASNGTFTGSGPYVFNPSFTFTGDQTAGMMYAPTSNVPLITSNTANQATLLLYNSDPNGLPGVDIRDNNYVRRGMLWMSNTATSRVRLVANTGSSLDFEAGGIADDDPTMRLTSAGGVYMKTLVGTGTRAVATDASGNLSATLAIASGTYTPTLTNGTNVAASTAFACQYMRIGNTITVSGRVDIDPTSTGATTLGISLPIASALTNDYQLGGTISPGIEQYAGSIRADAANDRAQVDFVVPASGSTANNSWFFSFTYQVL